MTALFSDDFGLLRLGRHLERFPIEWLRQREPDDDPTR
jgi:hypothetical protein